MALIKAFASISTRFFSFTLSAYINSPPQFKHKSLENILNVTLEFVESIDKKNGASPTLNYTPKVSLNNKQKSKIPNVKKFEQEIIEMFNKLRDEKIQQLKNLQEDSENEPN